MKKDLIFGLMCFLGLLFLTNIALSSEIIQKYGPTELVILDFVLVDSQQNGEILTRTFKIEVENKTDEPLYDVKFTLIHSSDQATFEEGEVYLGIMEPGQIVISSDSFVYSVDISKTALIPVIDLHWTVEYKDDKANHIIDESLFTETL